MYYKMSKTNMYINKQCLECFVDGSGMSLNGCEGRLKGTLKRNSKRNLKGALNGAFQVFLTGNLKGSFDC